MKIALVVPGFSAREGDWAIPALEEFARVLADRVELHVYPLRWPERRATYTVGRATIHALGGGHRLGLRVLALWRRAARAIADEHRRAPFDAVHAFWADEPAWLASWIARRLRAPAIVSLAGGELVGFRDLGYGLQRLPGRRQAVRLALARAAHITAGSAYLLDLARGHVAPTAWSKLSLAPLGVDLARFTPPAGRPADGRVLLNVGSLYPVKAQATLLRVLARLPDARLRIAGSGPLERQLARHASALGVAERVEWLGSVPYARMPGVYQAADVFVQASRHESQGMAALEAAASGLPVVGTPVGVLPEIGVTARDEDELTSTLTGLLADPARRLQVGRDARARVERQYSANACVERFIDLYARCGRTRTSS